MSDYDLGIKIDAHEEEKPEIQLPVIVFLPADADDQAEVRDRINQIRSVIEAALADEDNDLVSFVYPEVRLGVPTASTPGGFSGKRLDV